MIRVYRGNVKRLHGVRGSPRGRGFSVLYSLRRPVSPRPTGLGNSACINSLNAMSFLSGAGDASGTGYVWCAMRLRARSEMDACMLLWLCVRMHVGGRRHAVPNGRKGGLNHGPIVGRAFPFAGKKKGQLHPNRTNQSADLASARITLCCF